MHEGEDGVVDHVEEGEECLGRVGDEGGDENCGGAELGEVCAEDEVLCLDFAEADGPGV